MMRRESNPVLGIVLVLLVALATTAVGPRSLANGPNEQANAGAMKGMVAAVNTDERQVRVLTGTGHSLRVMVFHAGTECRIRVEGAAAGLEDLERGQVVAVRYRETSAPYHEAESMEATPMPAAGDRR